MLDPSFSLLLIVVAFCIATLVFGEIRNARGIFVIFMTVGAILPFVLALIFGIESPIAVMPLTGPEGIKAVSLCVLALGIVIYVSLFIERTSPSSRGRLTIYHPNEKLANIYSWLSIASSVFYVAFMAQRLGGITEMIIRLYQRVSLYDSVANYLTIVYFASFVFAVFSFCFSRGAGVRTARWLSYVALLVCFAQTLMLGGRSLVVLFGVAIFYVTLTRISLLRFTVAATVISILIAVTSYVMTNARFEAQNAAVLTERSDESFLSRATTGLTFVDHVAASIAYVHERGHDYGQSYVNTLLLPIPRDLWPDKPLQISVRMRDFLFGDISGGEPPGLFGEAYIAFGTIAVAIAAILLGLMIGRINVMTMIASKTGCRAKEAYVGILAPLIAYAVVRGGIDIAVLRVGIPAFWCIVAVKIADVVLRRQARQRFRRRTQNEAGAAISSWRAKCAD